MLCLSGASFCPPQLHITVSPDKVKINLDCHEVAEKPIKAANNITLDGYEVLGKMVKSGGGRRQSATVSENKSIHLERHPTTFQNEPHPKKQKLSFDCCRCLAESCVFPVLPGTLLCIFFMNGILIYVSFSCAVPAPDV